MAFAEGREGYQRLGPSGIRELRLDDTSGLVVSMGHGRFYEAVRSGRVYWATAVGATLGTALTATAVTLTLYNPLNSQVALSLLHVSVAITTPPAAAGVGSLVLAANVNPLAAVPATNTLATVYGNARLGAAPAQGVARAYTATTLPAAPVTIRSLGGWAFVGTATSSTGFPMVSDPVDGLITLDPNTAVTVQGILSASTWVGTVTFFWEECSL